MKQIAIKVQMSHGAFIVISLDSATTIAEAFDKVIKKTQLLDPANYYLYFCILFFSPPSSPSSLYHLLGFNLTR